MNPAVTVSISAFVAWHLGSMNPRLIYSTTSKLQRKDDNKMKEAFQGKEKEWAKVIAQAWVDEDFKAKLLADPKAVLVAEGIEFPENIKLNITEAKEDELNLTLPLKPADLAGSVEELQERMQATMPWWFT
jgi:hypothetical protein